MIIFQILIILISLSVGIFVYLNPSKVIDIQKKFYILINWRIEPISMPKEILSTRIMGATLVFLAVSAIIYILFK